MSTFQVVEYDNIAPAFKKATNDNRTDIATTSGYKQLVVFHYLLFESLGLNHIIAYFADYGVGLTTNFRRGGQKGVE